MTALMIRVAMVLAWVTTGCSASDSVDSQPTEESGGPNGGDLTGQPTCNNGVLELGEACETVNGVATFPVNMNSCQLVAPSTPVGLIGCTTTCQLDLSQCTGMARTNGGAGPAADGSGGTGGPPPTVGPAPQPATPSTGGTGG